MQPSCLYMHDNITDSKRDANRLPRRKEAVCAAFCRRQAFPGGKNLPATTAACPRDAPGLFVFGTRRVNPKKADEATDEHI
jgi:hypothetical protein